ncbi:hypothetical protein KIH39_24325 [Telmatocola sphagniphila]|jgi:hypothetical protein|uniref:Uncharacterized protein n=1 Tax=Telmatocola sphagniphila TaxID=1123043 RepID=A0A8E6B7P0_9BACT|nr:DddA-like double-stranded DNA deaminase toxin [Telmatocola sphagniphila]QVL31925.1 hypothetical protein KIH39_24325 [Telmatocola sphagniphila]
MIELPTFEQIGKTIGALIQTDGKITVLVSGYEGPGKGVRGIPKMNGLIKAHVEAQAAVLMRMRNLSQATLRINRVPCPTMNVKVLGCDEALPHMLPESASLTVIGPDEFSREYIGKMDPPRTRIQGLEGAIEFA